MKKQIIILSAAVIAITVYSCKKNTGSSLSGNVHLDLPATTAEYFPSGGFQSDSLNRLATLGRVLFYDGHLSVNNAISCASCHKQAFGFADNSKFSIGFEGRLTGRNSPGITSMREFKSLFWDGRETSLKNLILRPVTNHVEMGIDDAGVLPAKLEKLSYYPQLFATAFGDPAITTDRISTAMSTFLLAVGPNTSMSRFEEYQAGITTALTAQEIEGMNLFDIKYNCRSCHGGGNGGYSGSEQFKDIGLDATYRDNGRGAITQMTADKGTFKVPNLRNVGLTAPYMHDGRFNTLDEVVEHYSHNINNSPNLDTALKDQYGHAKSFNINESDKKAIVAFLNSLTDYKTTTDPKFSNPFKTN